MVDEIVSEPEVYINNTIDFSLKADLSFLSVLVHEGDLLNAITIACVFWKFLKEHSQSVKEVRRWIRCYLEILLSEEMFEEMVIIRNIVSTLNMAVDKDYVRILSLYHSFIEPQYHVPNSHDGRFAEFPEKTSTTIKTIETIQA